MKCLKCDGELKPILKDGKSYVQCDKCGTLFTSHDLKNRPPQSQNPQPIQTRVVPDEEEYEDYSLGKIATITGWILCALFLLFALACGSAIPLVAFLVAAVLVSPVFRNHVYLSGKIWIPLIMVLTVAGFATTPQSDAGSKKVAQKQESSNPEPKQIKASAKKEDKKDTEKEAQERAAQEQAEREEQERIAQEQAEQERLAQEQAAAQAEQERIAQEQAAAQAEQERIAQEQAAAQAEQQRLEQERIAQEQAAAAQAEQERIAQANAGQNPFNTYNNPDQQQTSSAYVLNTNTKKFHYPNCNDVKKIAPQNYSEFNGTRDDAINQGYSSCGHCNP